MRVERSMLSASSSVARLKATGVRLGLAVLVFFLLAACGGERKESAPSGQQTQTSVPGFPAGSAAPSATVPAKTYNIGDVVEYDGWTVAVLRVQPRWVSASQGPSAGSRFVALELQVTNKGPDIRNSPIPFFCTLVQSPSAEHRGLLVIAGPSPRFDSSNIPPNQPRTGWGTFQAADVEGLFFQCEPGAVPDVSLDPSTMLIWDLGL